MIDAYITICNRQIVSNKLVFKTAYDWTAITAIRINEVLEPTGWKLEPFKWIWGMNPELKKCEWRLKRI